MSLLPQSLQDFYTYVSTVFDTFKLQLTPGIRYLKLWCQARELLSPLSLATKMSTSKLIQ